jgi:hypothetical protein
VSILRTSNYYVTNGGTDSVTFGSGHAGADHVGFYDANGNANAGGAYAVAGLTNSISFTPNNANEFANPGFSIRMLRSPSLQTTSRNPVRQPDIRDRSY